jgi:hypothetical protein
MSCRACPGGLILSLVPPPVYFSPVEFFFSTMPLSNSIVMAWTMKKDHVALNY